MYQNQKNFNSPGLAVSLLVSMCVPAYAASQPDIVNNYVNSAYGYKILDSTIVLGESIQDLYFDPETDTQISEPEVLRSR